MGRGPVGRIIVQFGSRADCRWYRAAPGIARGLRSWEDSLPATCASKPRRVSSFPAEHENHHGRTLMKTASIIAAASALLLSGMANAADIKVLSTQATEEAYRELVPQFEKASGHKVATTFTGTLGAMKRLADGETYDLLIMSSS